MNDIGVTNKRVTAKLPDKPVTSHPGLEKIEPLDVVIIPAEVMRVEESLVNKLNEVIEAVNKMMEVMKERGNDQQRM